MSMLPCVLWWLVLGSLLGWLGSWLLGRLLAHPTPPPVERLVDRIVEKTVDNPAHLARISALESEVAGIAALHSQIQQFKATPPAVVEKIVEKPVDRIVEKVVEKLVDNPAHLARISALESEVALIAGLRSEVQQLKATPPTVVEKVVETVVEKIVEVDRVVPLNATAARLAGFGVERDDQLEIIEGIGPKIADLLRAQGVTTFRQLAETSPERLRVILDAAGPAYRIADPGTWPEQAALAADNRWESLAALQAVLDAGVRTDPRKAIGDLKALIADRDAEIARLTVLALPPADLDAARAAGFAVTGPDEIEIVEGIGPKIGALLREAGIDTFARLAQTAVPTIQVLLDNAGPAFRMANPETWPEQAALAAGNHWRALRALQDMLTAGNR
jgi:predicted flap endonuclease-1-like 5' DNA nuclease